MSIEQAKIFCIFFVLGLITAILFDIFRIIRKNIKTNYLFTSIEDFIYIITVGFLFLKSLIVFCNGNIRFYIFFAFFTGIITYILTIKNFCDIIISAIIKTIILIIKIVLIPIRFLYINLNNLLKNSKIIKQKIKEFLNRSKVTHEKHS